MGSNPTLTATFRIDKPLISNEIRGFFFACEKVGVEALALATSRLGLSWTRMANRHGRQSPSRMRTNYVLIDYENLPVDSLELLQPEHFRLRIFLGPNNTKLPSELAIAVHRLHDRADYIQLETPGKNALDFHIAYYLGRLALKEPTAYFHIISADKGFDPLIKHLKGKGISAARSESIEDLPCFKSPAIVSAAVPKPEPVKPAQVEAKKPLDDATIKLVVADLIARKAAKPRTIKTLLNTIHAKVGKTTAITEIEGIYKVLRQRGYVKESGTKVSYALPQGA
ncbi:PIN domain-containing protein [Pseudomonas sp. MOB-449]|nr:PIN domain-containing protein [Pseudomonas sp. MOB-449]